MRPGTIGCGRKPSSWRAGASRFLKDIPSLFRSAFHGGQKIGSDGLVDLFTRGLPARLGRRAVRFERIRSAEQIAVIRGRIAQRIGAGVDYDHRLAPAGQRSLGGTGVGLEAFGRRDRSDTAHTKAVITGPAVIRRCR